MNYHRSSLIVCLALFLLVPTLTWASGDPPASKPGPDQIIEFLTKGNERFASGQATHPHADPERVILASKENQGNHALATVLSCSDSRVPPERLFDVGVMDIFVVRVAGNVANTDEIGSIEYGLAHVNTPLLVVLGHTQCGAVNAVTAATTGHGHPLERNIPPLVAPIGPAVKKAMTANPKLQGPELVAQAIVQNVYQSIEDIFLKSAAVRELIKSGKVKVVGAIYDLGTGKVSWLPAAKSAEILAQVEANPKKATKVMADAHGDKEEPAAKPAPAPAPSPSIDREAEGRVQAQLKELDKKIENLGRDLAKAMAERDKVEKEKKGGVAEDLTPALREQEKKMDERLTALGRDLTKSTTDLQTRLEEKVTHVNDGLTRFAWITGIGLLILFGLMLWLILARTSALAAGQSDLRARTRQALGELKREIRQNR